MKLLLSAAVAATALAAAACGGSNPPPSPPQSSPPASSPAPPPTSSSPTPSGPVQGTWGEGHGSPITSEGGADATVSALSETATTQPADPEIGSKPTNGYFVIIDVRADNLTSATGSFDFNPLDFYVRVNGAHYDEANGNSFDALSSSSEELSATTLNPGEHTTGKIVFDVPSPNGTLVYAPNISGESLIEWKY